MKLNLKSALLLVLALTIVFGSFAISKQSKASELEIFGVASNSFGYYIYVADSIHNRVIKYDLLGNYLADFIKTEKNGPCPTWDYKGLIAVSVCRVTDVFAVTDHKLKRVFTFNPNSVPHHPLGDPAKNELLNPWHASETEIADDIGNYVIDKDGNKFVRYDPPAIDFDKQAVECEVYGRMRFSVPNGYNNKPAPAGKGDGQFDTPEGIAVDRRGYVIVADTGNNRIQKFRRNGEYVMKWGTSGSGPGQFNKPVYVIPDYNDDSPNRYYVCDQGNNRIQIFDEYGKFIDECKPMKDGKPLFERIVACAIDMDFNIWVADAATQRVYKLASMDSPKKYQLLMEISAPMDPPPVFIHVTRAQLKKYFATVDEDKIQMKPFAQMLNGRTMVPMRWVAENVFTNPPKGFVGSGLHGEGAVKGVPFKCDVAWDEKSKCATFTMEAVKFSDKLTYPKTVVKICLGNPVATVNGKQMPIDSTNPKVTAEIINDKMMVPLRFLEEAFGAEVRFKLKTETPKTTNDEVIVLFPSTTKVKEAYGIK